MIPDSTERSSTRVENYVKYRPDYPLGVLETLGAHCGFTPATIVADVGSGTVIFTRQLVAHGNLVYAVEPNGRMRAAAAELLAGQPGYHNVEGTAENTTLAVGSVDMVTAAQAFPWFDRDARGRNLFASSGPMVGSR